MRRVMRRNDTGLSAAACTRAALIDAHLSGGARARHTQRVRERLGGRNRRAPAAGSASSATWTSRCTRPGSATTAPARTSSGAAATSPRRRRSRGCSVRCVAQQCAEVLRGMATADRSWRSARAAAAWRWMCCRGSRRSARCPTRYLILEISADLRERQRRAIAARSAASRGARRVARGAARRRLRRRHSRQRGARCIAGGALSLASRRAARNSAWRRERSLRLGAAARERHYERGVRRARGGGRRMGGRLRVGVLPTARSVDPAR